MTCSRGPDRVSFSWKRLKQLAQAQQATACPDPVRPRLHSLHCRPSACGSHQPCMLDSACYPRPSSCRRTALCTALCRARLGALAQVCHTHNLTSLSLQNSCILCASHSTSRWHQQCAAAVGDNELSVPLTGAQSDTICATSSQHISLSPVPCAAAARVCTSTTRTRPFPLTNIMYNDEKLSTTSTASACTHSVRSSSLQLQNKRNAVRLCCANTCLTQPYQAENLNHA